MSQHEANKHTVIAFYDLMFNQCRPRKRSSATSARATPSTTRTWPTARTRSSNTSSAWLASIPAKVDSSECSPKATRGIALPPGLADGCEQDWAGIDIFRFDEQGKIVEHWDVLQVVPAKRRTRTGCGDASLPAVRPLAAEAMRQVLRRVRNERTQLLDALVGQP